MAWVAVAKSKIAVGHELIPAIGRKVQELALHRVDSGEIGRDEVVATALAGDHPKLAACESRGGTGAAEMDEGGKILLLLRACRHIARAGENRCHVAIQVHRRKLCCMARDHAEREVSGP